jgi:ubiquinone/menaquinone biosynthesis C-methylase UbiE
MSIDWQHWVVRWDRMQDWHVPARAARFDCLVRLIRSVHKEPDVILDLGCGTGSLTVRLAEAFPSARVCGLDLDATLLLLARARCAALGERVSLVEADLQLSGWCVHIPGRGCCAAVSTTALHWLSESGLHRLYADLARVVRPGENFLNADHVGSPVPGIQGCGTVRGRRHAGSPDRAARTTAHSGGRSWQR